MASREHIERDGPGRRREDNKCPWHDLLWELHDKDTKEHRDLVCAKISKKAEVGEVFGLKKFICLMITLSCIVIAGIAAWLKVDIGRLDVSVTRLHQRLSEKIDYDYTSRERLIDTLNGIDKRLAVIEDDKK